MSTRLLLDTSSLAYRAFHALPGSITAPDGTPVNAVRGYLDMTARLIVDRAPDTVAHVYDHDWRPADRVAAYAGYKARRAEEPPELTRQFALLRDVLDALGQTQVEAPGWEADDAIAVLVAQAGADDRVDVVTGDRDLTQLVRDARDGVPAIRLLYTVKGVSQLQVLDEAGVLARHGVSADRYVDYAILRGDPSDGLPGVRGVGEKTARRLIAEHGSLAALRAAGAELTPRVRAAIAEAGDYLDAMTRVVPVRADVAVRSWGGERDDAALESLARTWALDGPIRRLREALDA